MDETTWVRVPGGEVEVADTGGDGPVVVLLHGVVMDHRVWDDVLPHLPERLRVVRPVLPLGSHRRPVDTGADQTLLGIVHLLADLLEAMDLSDVTLVVSDWGGPLLLTHLGRDDRVARLVVCPSEAWENFPPGLPGRVLALAARVPGGVGLALRVLRSPLLRRGPLAYGPMAARPVRQELLDAWTDPGLADPAVRGDLRAYAARTLPREELVAATERLRDFDRPALVLWGEDARMTPLEHGRRLADLLPRGELVVVPDARVLVMLDQPEAVARALVDFLARTGA